MATAQPAPPPSPIRPQREEGTARCCGGGGLRTGIEVTTEAGGRVVAAVHVQGLCGSTVSALVTELDDLLAMGVADVTVHLDAVTACPAGADDVGIPHSQPLVRFDLSEMSRPLGRSDGSDR